MVIERFDGDDMAPVYRRLAERGRGLPEGVAFEASWVEIGCGRCFQLMRADDAAALRTWVLGWRGAGVRFEVVPVTTGAETAALYAALREEEPT